MMSCEENSCSSNGVVFISSLNPLGADLGGGDVKWTGKSPKSVAQRRARNGSRRNQTEFEVSSS